MIHLELDTLFSLQGHGLARRDVFSSSGVVASLIEKVQSRGQGFLDLPRDGGGFLKAGLPFAQNVRGKFRHVVVLGIGGSALGARALTAALATNAMKHGNPTLHILDNVDPELIERVEHAVDLKKTLFIVVTKSGATPETLAQYFYFRKKMEKLLGAKKVRGHFAFVTDPKRGHLREIAHRDGITAFDVPENVGGRFSVLSAVGLLPAALIGIDVRKLLKGGLMALNNFFEKDSKKNMAFQLARTQFLLQQKKGVNITVMMSYSGALRGIAEWYAQLLAESIGKSHARDGKVIHAGITPVCALGVTDQHSQVQLYNEGPFDKFVLFLETKKFRSDISVPKIQEKSFDFLSGVSFGELMRVEKRATESAFVKFDRPCGSIVLDGIDEEHLGELFVMLECSVAFLGEMYGIDAFDQPGVELAKTLTKKMLRAGS